MNQSQQPSAAALRRGRSGLRVLLASLVVVVVLAACGSSKQITSQAARTSTAAAAATQSTPGATAAQAKRTAAVRRRARLAAARRAAHARAVRLQAKRAAAARVRAQHAAAAAAAARKAAQAAAKKKAQTTTTPTAQTPPKPKGTIVSVNATSLGGVLIDAKGHTLYLFAKDSPGHSACSASCAGVWPPLTTTGTPVAGQGATQSKLGTINRAGGVLQVTYNGHPLYLFVGDAHGGQTTGEGLNQFGGLWWAVSAAGQKVMG